MATTSETICKGMPSILNRGICYYIKLCKIFAIRIKAKLSIDTQNNQRCYV